MLIKAFCHPAESFHPSKLSKLVKESGFGISEVSLLFTAVTNRLSDYKTSVQEDSEILEKLKGNDSFRPLTGPFRKRYKMAVQVRKGEKEILHHVMQLCQALLAEQTSHSTGYSAKRKRNENETAPVNNKKTTRV